MEIYFDETGSVAALRESAEMALKDGAGGLVVLACDGNDFTPHLMNPFLRSLTVPVVGGAFPAITHKGKSFQRGSVVLGFRGRVTTAAIHGLSSGNVDLEKPLEDFADRSAGARTMLVFVDGFSLRMYPFINGLFDAFGLEVNYIGGGAGSLVPGRERRPCLFTDSGVISDGAVMALVETVSGVGAAHGWQTLGEPMQVTGVDGHTLRSINFRKAFDAYVSAVTQHVHTTIEKDNLVEVSRRFPFGIARMNGEMIVRDVLEVTPDGDLVCAGEIPLDCYVSIMTGNQETLIAAAGKAAAAAAAALFGAAPTAYLLMDCISRRHFLGDRFDLELAQMSPERVPSAGACTIGEIANSGTEFLEFYNKTAVVAAMGYA